VQGIRGCCFYYSYCALLSVASWSATGADPGPFHNSKSCWRMAPCPSAGASMRTIPPIIRRCSKAPTLHELAAQMNTLVESLPSTSASPRQSWAKEAAEMQSDADWYVGDGGIGRQGSELVIGCNENGRGGSPRTNRHRAYGHGSSSAASTTHSTRKTYSGESAGMVGV
jgi:hypothetical protein